MFHSFQNITRHFGPKNALFEGDCLGVTCVNVDRAKLQQHMKMTRKKPKESPVVCNGEGKR